jgi:hypothetical protein
MCVHGKHHGLCHTLLNGRWKLCHNLLCGVYINVYINVYIIVCIKSGSHRCSSSATINCVATLKASLECGLHSNHALCHHTDAVTQP